MNQRESVIAQRFEHPLIRINDSHASNTQKLLGVVSGMLVLSGNKTVGR